MSRYTQFNKAFSYSVFVFCLLLISLSIYLFSEAGSEPIFTLFGLLVLAASVFMLFAARKTMRNANASEWKEIALDEALASSNENDLVLAEWVFSREEWLYQTRNFKRINKRLELLVSAGIIFLFLVLWLIFKDDAILVVGLFATILYLILRLAKMKSIYRLRGKQAIVIISTDVILINGRHIHFADGHRYLKRIEKRTSRGLDYLIFEIAWPTGKGFDNSTDIRIPIPKNQALQAHAVLSKLRER